MLFPTHVVGGITAGLMLTKSTNIETVAIVALISGIAALLPDIDSPDSFIGGNLPIASYIIKGTVGHRGATHSLMAALLGTMLFTIIIKMIAFDLVTLATAFLAGYLSHLVLDTLNPAGVPLLWPIPIQLRLPLTQPGGVLEKIVVFPVLAAWILTNAHKLGGGIL